MKYLLVGTTKCCLAFVCAARTWRWARVSGLISSSGLGQSDYLPIISLSSLGFALSLATHEKEGMETFHYYELLRIHG